MNKPEEDGKDPNLDQAEFIQLVSVLRQKAYRQILFGLAWWVASAIAIYSALSTTSSSILWFGGALGSLFHWQRAYKLMKATYEVGAKRFVKKELIAIGITTFIVVSSAAVIVPEYMRIQSPTIGTCWASKGLELFVPVACWSSEAEIKTIGFSDTAETCPIESSGYFDPSSQESRFTCVEDLK